MFNATWEFIWIVTKLKFSTTLGTANFSALWMPCSPVTRAAASGRKLEGSVEVHLNALARSHLSWRVVGQSCARHDPSVNICKCKPAEASCSANALKPTHCSWIKRYFWMREKHLFLKCNISGDMDYWQLLNASVPGTKVVNRVLKVICRAVKNPMPSGVLSPAVYASWVNGFIPFRLLPLSLECRGHFLHQAVALCRAKTV